MLRIDEKTIAHVERQYSGFKEVLLRFESATLPAYPHCGSANTASVQVGLVGITINLAAATTKFKLVPNGPKPGNFFAICAMKFLPSNKRLVVAT